MSIGRKEFIPAANNNPYSHPFKYYTKSLAYRMEIYDAQVQTAKIHYDNMSESSFIRVKINYIKTTQESSVVMELLVGTERLLNYSTMYDQ